MRTVSQRSPRGPMLALLILVSLTLLAIEAGRGAPAAIDWDARPTHVVKTTEGSFSLDIHLKLARNQTDIFFLAWFDYPVTPGDPDQVYFAVEFDVSGAGRPMAAGNEMLIVSREGPEGAMANHFTYIVERTEGQPVLAATNIVTLDSLERDGSSYVFQFHRPLLTGNPIHHQFEANTTVRADFAVGEWGIGRSHAYTTMRYVLNVTRSEVLLNQTAPSGIRLEFTKGTAILLGRGILLLTVIFIGIHVFRRRVWSPEDHPSGDGTETVEVARHPIPVRVTHMVHLVLLVTFVATGWSMLASRPLFGPWTLPVHIVAAFVVMVNIPLHFLVLLLAGEWRTLVRINRDDISVLLRLVANFFGLSKEYPEHATYEPERGAYYRGRKYCAYQKLLLWGDTLFIGAMAVTGFALYYPGGLAWLVGALGGSETALALHDLFFYLLSSTVLGHFYFSIIPSNWTRLRSMVRGVARIVVHRQMPSDEARLGSTGKSSEGPP